MIQLRLLGTLALRDDAGADHSTLFVRSKQLALLTYLCTATPRGFQQRNTLLALLWPESDEQRARLSLRQALHGLRSELGSEAIVARGDEEIAIDRSALWCDATAFEDEIDAGNLEAALELYTGPLLSGVVIPGLSEFHIWLDGRRDTLRRRAASAAATLSERAEQAGDLEKAVEWARRCDALAPYEEQPIRRQLTLMEMMGDRVGAVRAYERWAARLRADMDGEPSAETTELVERIRGEGPTARMDLHEAGEVPADVPIYRKEGSGWPRPFASLRVTSVVVIVIAVAVGITAMLGRTRSNSPVSGTVVLPFQYLGDKETEYLGGAMSLLMSASLGQQGPLASVDPRAVAGIVATRTPSDGDDLRYGARVAKQLRAKYFIAGTVVRADRAIRVESGLYETSTDAPVARAAGEGDVDSVFAIAERVANDLLSERIGGAPTAALGTKSVPALKAYLAGERELLGSRYSEAADDFGQAIEADSNFARAWYRSSYAAGWAGRSVVALAAADRALAMSARLEPGDRELARAWRDFVYGDVIAASREYEDIVTRNPRQVEGWLQLAELRYHWGAQLGTSPAAAADAFRHVLALAPDQAAALIHLARLEARQPATTSFDSLAKAAMAAPLDAIERMELNTLVAARRGDSASVRVAMDDAARHPEAIAQVVKLLFAVPGAASDSMVARLTRAEEATDQDGAQLAMLQRAQTAAGRGDFPAALMWTDSLGRLNVARGAEVRAWIALLPEREGNRAELRAARAGLSATRTDAWVAHGDRDPLTRAVYPPRREYLLGALALTIGDTAAASAAAAALETKRFERPGDSVATLFAHRFGRLLRAEMQLRAGKAAAALDILGQAAPEPGGTFPDVMSYVHARERYVRAVSLEKAGRKAEAARWWATFPDPSGYDVWYLPSGLGLGLGAGAGR